eukprot:Skav222705  [mRNA]  locus=scaffold402:606233:611917:+ [translate_table: standard]
MTFHGSQCRRGSVGLRQVRIAGLARATLVLLLRWAYGEAVPSLGGDDGDGTISLTVAFDLLEAPACSKFEVERLETLLREVVSDLFRLGRVWKDAEEPGTATARPAPAVPGSPVDGKGKLADKIYDEEMMEMMEMMMDL